PPRVRDRRRTQGPPGALGARARRASEPRQAQPSFRRRHGDRDRGSREAARRHRRGAPPRPLPRPCARCEDRRRAAQGRRRFGRVTGAMAVDERVRLAREALREITPDATVGELIDQRDAGEHVTTLSFAATMLGYPGWAWTVSVAQLPGEAPTVLEAELLPGEGALLAPDWVPWSERLEEYRAAQAAAAAEAAEQAADDDEDDDADDLDEHDIDDDFGDDPDDGIDFEHEDADDADTSEEE